MSAKRAGRSDAAANVVRIRDAALDLLGRGDDPSMAEVAAAAGVSRQTLYSHFRSRRQLYDALVAHLTAETAAALDGAPLPDDPAAALAEWVERAWRVLDTYPAALNPALYGGAGGDDPAAEHGPIVGGLHRVLATASERGVLVRDATADWLVAAVVALGHAAAHEVMAGRMSRAEAGVAFRTGALRVCLRPPEASVARPTVGP